MSSPNDPGYCCEVCTPTRYDADGYLPVFALDIRRCRSTSSFRWMASVRIGKRGGSDVHATTLLGALWASGRLAWKWHREWKRRTSGAPRPRGESVTYPRTVVPHEKLYANRRVYVKELDVFGRVSADLTLVICEDPMPGYEYQIRPTSVLFHQIELLRAAGETP